MTDEQVIKALECCANWESDKSCEDCPANTYGFGCANKMAKHSLDLINQQKAEIEQWKEEANKYQSLWCEAVTDLQTAKFEAIKLFADRLRVKFMYNKAGQKAIDNTLKEMVGEE